MHENGPPQASFARLVLPAVAVVVVLMAVFFAIAFFRVENASTETAQTKLSPTESRTLSELRGQLKGNPDDTAARYELGLGLRSIDLGDALAEFQKIPADSPEYPSALKQIAGIYLFTEQNVEFEEALAILQKLIPEDPAIWLASADYASRHGRSREAVSSARRAAELPPETADKWLLMADMLDRRNKWPEMVDPLRSALRLEPENYDVHASLAYALHAAGALDEARVHANWCIERHPDDVFPRRVLAAIARDSGEIEQAEKLVQQALTLAPAELETRILEADLLMYRRQPEQAYQRLAELRDAGGDSFRFLGALSRAAAATGRTDEAERLAEELSRRQDGRTH